MKSLMYTKKINDVLCFCWPKMFPLTTSDNVFT